MLGWVWILEAHQAVHLSNDRAFEPAPLSVDAPLYGSGMRKLVTWNWSGVFPSTSRK